MVGWVEQMSVDHHFVILDFRVAILDDSPPIAGSDADEAAWVDLASLDGVPLVNGLASFLAEPAVVPGSFLSLDCPAAEPSAASPARRPLLHECPGALPEVLGAYHLASGVGC